MPVSIVTSAVGVDPEAIEHAHENQVQLAVGEQGTGAHAVSHPVGEHGSIGLLEPTFWPEFFGVGPYVRICDFISACLFFFFFVASVEDLPILQAHEFKKNTVPFGITAPLYVISLMDVRGSASRRTV